MNTKNIIIAVVLVVVAFFGGMKYGQSKTVTPTGGTGNFAQGAGGRGGRFAGGGVGAVTGNVLSVDSTGITVQMRDGSTKIVVVPASAMIVKSVPGTAADLVVGKGVIANGTANSDGSITASNVQVRQAMTMSTTTGR